jgi:hypothetical protein
MGLDLTRVLLRGCDARSAEVQIGLDEVMAKLQEGSSK